MKRKPQDCSKNAPRPRKKPGSAGGYTLVETLTVLLLVSLAGGMFVAAVNTLLRQGRQRGVEAEARTLCATLCLAAQDRLSYGGAFSFSGGAAGELTSFTAAAAAPGEDGALCAFEDRDGVVYLNCGGVSAPLESAAAYAGGALRAALSVSRQAGANSLLVTVRVYAKNAPAAQRPLAEKSLSVRPVLAGALDAAGE